MSHFLVSIQIVEINFISILCNDDRVSMITNIYNHLRKEEGVSLALLLITLERVVQHQHPTQSHVIDCITRPTNMYIFIFN